MSVSVAPEHKTLFIHLLKLTVGKKVIYLLREKDLNVCLENPIYF